jgi:hypothetical protein
MRQKLPLPPGNKFPRWATNADQDLHGMVSAESAFAQAVLLQAG